ncbi:MAG: Fe-S cluster assembly protein SufD [Armatimonadetes bacterium]|nr:Fe-S cluster assembly protein SufD [Armatimonadota bacterium]
MAAAVAQGITRETVEALSARLGEPEWLRSRRREAWETFESVPWPDASQEAWKRVDLKLLNLDAYRPWVPAGTGGPEAMPARLRPSLAETAGGLVIQRNSEGVYSRLSDDLRHAGVLFTSLDEAVRRWPERVEAHLGRAVAPVMGKFEALQGALWSGGAFLYVPRDVDVAVPLVTSTWMDAMNGAIFPRVLIVVEQGGAVTLIDEQASLTEESEAFVSPVVEGVVGDGARVSYTSIQHWGGHAREVGTRRFLVGRDARLDWVTVTLGARLSRMRLQASFEGAGSESRLRGLYFPGDNQELHLDTLQDHRAPHTLSDLFFKGALRDAARAVYYGVIRVHPEAQRTNGYQQNRNLLLSDRAKADSVPILEIEANDVRCSHGATVGQVDPEQLFYLMARGLPRPEAEQILVEGFFRQILDAVPDAALRERVAALVAEKAAGEDNTCLTS